MANYPSPYNGWLWSTPSSTNTFQQSYPFTVSSGLDFNNFYTYAPMVLTLYSEEIGDIRYWPAYDGPVANWDTYANGVYITDYLLTSGTAIYAIPGYPATTYTDAMTSIWLTGVTGGYVPTSGNYITNYDGDEAPYIAVYIHEYSDDVENIAGSNAKGWYVFKNDIPSTGTYGRTQWETPIAWPSDVSTSRNIAANEQGFLGSNAGIQSGYIVVFLDEYNDPVGSGGTDHWTKPPWVFAGIPTGINQYNEVQMTDLAGNTLQIYGLEGTYNGRTDFGSYQSGPIRDNTSLYVNQRILFRSYSAYGSIPVKIYQNDILTHTGTANFTGTGGSVVVVTIANVYYANGGDYAANLNFGTDKIFAVLEPYD